jgi:hypothetical protein
LLAQFEFIPHWLRLWGEVALATLATQPLTAASVMSCLHYSSLFAALWT